MITGFETYLRTQTNISDAEIELTVSTAKPRSLSRNELLLQQGQICRHKTFIIKGLLRTFGTAHRWQRTYFTFLSRKHLDA